MLCKADEPRNKDPEHTLGSGAGANMDVCMPESSPAAPASTRSLLSVALALSLGAAISLGITRFAYGLLLPVMREDLNWTYTLAGTMNTANALGYLLGALVTPGLIRRMGALHVLLGGALLAALFMGLSGFFTDAWLLLLQRVLSGISSALVFIAGGLMAARLGAVLPSRAGLVLGIYYGGTGWGIAISALAVPFVLATSAGQPHSWAWAWWVLGLVCLVAALAMGLPSRHIARLTQAQAEQATQAAQGAGRFQWRPMGFALTGYALFGVGYIGYMTFVIALLRTQGLSADFVTLFYALLGLAVVLSARLWAALLDRYRGGQALALLNFLLGVATLLPALTANPAVVLLSGLMFGGVFLSVVASTTALVRHNLAPEHWAAGISAFTIVFALGQIVGPTVVGAISDGPGGLAGGFVFSALALWLGAVLAWRQRSLRA